MEANRSADLAGIVESVHVELFNEEDFRGRLREGWEAGVVAATDAYFYGDVAAKKWIDAAAGKDPFNRGLKRLFACDAWEKLISDRPIDTIVEFGAGEGKTLQQFNKWLLARSHTVLTVDVDMNARLLREATALQRELPEYESGRLRVAGVHADFHRLRDVLDHPQIVGLRPEGGGRALLTLLGGTFGNFPPMVAIELLRSNSKPGDLIIVSMEMLSTADAKPRGIKRLFDKYYGDWFVDYTNSSASTVFELLSLPGTPALEPPRIDRTPDYAALRAFVSDGERSVQIALTGRFAEGHFLKLMEENGLRHVARAHHPKQQYHCYYIFERETR